MIKPILNIRPLLAAALLLCISFPVLAQEGGAEGFWFPQGTNPAGDTFARPADMPPTVSDEPTNLLRTGIKKGIRGNMLESELSAAPDAAVLKNGFFEPWPALLFAFREPAVLVDSVDVAGLETTKPFLIIPSGGLSGHAASEFFKASLLTYVRSGGAIIVFAQQNGEDLSALPLPEGSRSTLAGAGWAQDSSPLFRASSVQSAHPLLSGTGKSIPALETSGYLTAWPERAQIVLARSDGYPTLIVYPVGSGWVVVTTLFSDYSFGQGRLDPDEKVLVRDLVAWAKAPNDTLQISAGRQLDANLVIHGPDQGKAVSARITLAGPGKTTVPDQNVTLPAMQGTSVTLPFSCKVPDDLPPGNYHWEYVLLDAAGRPLTTAAEADAGRFSLGRPTVAAPLQKQKQPLRPFPLPLRVEPLLQAKDSSMVTVSITASDETGLTHNQEFFMRLAGQEKNFRFTADKAQLTFERSAGDAAAPITYAIYHSGGRSLARGTIAPGAAARGLSFDRTIARAGKTIKALAGGMGRGELTVTGPGVVATEVVADKIGFDLALPKNLPTGLYPVSWSLQKIDGSSQEGGETLAISGYTVVLQNVIVRKEATPSTNLTAQLQVKASIRLPVTARLLLRGPDGNMRQPIERSLTLNAGLQELSLPITTRIDQAGIWELSVSLWAKLPEGPGLPAKPVSLAAGRALFDAGNAAVLGIVTDRPLYYDASGPVAVSAYVAGTGRAKWELSLDDKRIQKDRIELADAAVRKISIPAPGPGTHTLKAALSNDAGESARSRMFIYGAYLADLTVVIQAPQPAGPVLPIGIGVRNEGRSTAGPSRLAVYDGDPAAGGKLIEQVAVHQLMPGDQQVVLINWPLYKKTGTRTLYAVADIDHAVTESNVGNNSTSVEVQVPDLLLGVFTGKSSFTADEDIAVTLTAVNLTDASFKGLALTLQLSDQAGKTVHTETIRIDELAPGKEQRMDRSFRPPVLPAGAYKLAARLSRERTLAAKDLDIAIVPTLSVRGNLGATPGTAAPCRPFSLQYQATSAGNIPVSAGALTLEIRAANAAQPVFTRQVPFTDKPATLTIDNVQFSQGTYTLQLKAAVTNQSHKLSRNQLLAEQQLTVTGPITVQRSSVPLPRVLIWQGAAATTLERALSEALLKQSFQQEGIYARTVENAADFTSQAMTGLYNIYVLFETNDSLPRTDWLRERLQQGQGLVLIGSGEGVRTAAEEFGFNFTIDSKGESKSLVNVSRDAEFGLSGTIPVTGPVPEARKKDARTVATLNSTDRPAVLVDRSEGGTIVLAPFSLVQSTRDAGTLPLYSLLLKNAVLHALPAHDPADKASREITLSSLSGAVRTRLIETLPSGAKLLWQNQGTVKNNALTLELTVDQEQRSLQYLFTPSGSGKDQPTTEVLYECNGKFVSQGKRE